MCPKKNIIKRGARIDCVWYDRAGEIKVAIEVETKSNWKKDLVSTWEVEPDLAIIMTAQKTDNVPKVLTDYSLMKAMPHKLLYLNWELKSVYLFEKQQILKKSSIKQEEEINRDEIQKI